MDDLYLTTEDLGGRVKPMTSTGAKNPVTPIVSLLFKAINDAHITHLLQADKTLAKHNAMSLFYDGPVGDLADQIMEVSMGLHGETDITVASSSKIINAVDYFQKLYNNIEALRKPIKESFIQNIVDEVQSEIAHTLYRLKYITT